MSFTSSLAFATSSSRVFVSTAGFFGVRFLLAAFTLCIAASISSCVAVSEASTISADSIASLRAFRDSSVYISGSSKPSTNAFASFTVFSSSAFSGFSTEGSFVFRFSFASVKAVKASSTSFCAASGLSRTSCAAFMASSSVFQESSVYFSLFSSLDANSFAASTAFFSSVLSTTGFFTNASIAAFIADVCASTVSCVAFSSSNTS